MSVVAVNLSGFSPLDEEFDQHLTLLDATSQARIRRFKRREDALRCLIGRLLPLYLLSHLGLNSAGSPVTFQTDSHGRPSLAQPILDPPMDYNISHDGDWVVMGWSHGVGAAVGVDVMRLGLPNGIKNADELVEALEEQLSSHERRTLASTPPSDRTIHLLRLWMHKEAIAKLLGTGSAEDFATLSFDLTPWDVSTAGGAMVKQPPGALSTVGRSRCESLADVTLWEARLDGYGVVLAMRGSGSGAAVEVRRVAVADVLDGARQVRAIV